MTIHRIVKHWRKINTDDQEKNLNQNAIKDNFLNVLLCVTETLKFSRCQIAVQLNFLCSAVHKVLKK